MLTRSVTGPVVPGQARPSEPTTAAPATGASPKATASTKIVIAGGFGVGKTTLVGQVSEIEPLRTEALVTNVSEGVDDLSATPAKHTTTVAMDFGRLTLGGELVLYLFGTPGQERFWFMWDDIFRGAIGAVLLVDTNRLETAFTALDYFEEQGVPYIVAVNQFEGTAVYELDTIREALAIDAAVPMMRVDVRDREQAKQALVKVTEHALNLLIAKATGN